LFSQDRERGLAKLAWSERAADAQLTIQEAQVVQAKRLVAVRSRGMGTIVGGNYYAS